MGPALRPAERGPRWARGCEAEAEAKAAGRVGCRAPGDAEAAGARPRRRPVPSGPRRRAPAGARLGRGEWGPGSAARGGAGRF